MCPSDFMRISGQRCVRLLKKKNLREPTGKTRSSVYKSEKKVTSLKENLVSAEFIVLGNITIFINI